MTGIELIFCDSINGTTSLVLARSVAVTGVDIVCEIKASLGAAGVFIGTEVDCFSCNESLVKIKSSFVEIDTGTIVVDSPIVVVSINREDSFVGINSNVSLDSPTRTGSLVEIEFVDAADSVVNVEVEVVKLVLSVSFVTGAVCSKTHSSSFTSTGFLLNPSLSSFMRGSSFRCIGSSRNSSLIGTDTNDDDDDGNRVTLSVSGYVLSLSDPVNSSVLTTDEYAESISESDRAEVSGLDEELFFTLITELLSLSFLKVYN